MRIVLQRLALKSLYVQRKRWLRKIRSKQKALYRARGQSWFGQNRAHTIKYPFAINISSKNNRRFTLKFFDQIRISVIDHNRPISIDLSGLKFILPAAALLMIAEVDRAKRLMGSDFRVKLIPSETHRINAVLDQIGFSGICDTKLSSEAMDEADDELVRHWRYAT